MKNIIAKSKSELLKIIKNINITVPERTKGRTTEDTEKYSIVQFLITYLRQNKLEFPLSLIHRDKPDFLLTLNCCKIGIECTESIPEQFAWAQAILEENFTNGILEPEFFRWNSPKRNKKEILNILSKSQEELHGDPWYGNSVEKEWARSMNECFEAKMKKLNSKNFKIFKHNYLLIYDNLSQCLNNLNLSTNLLFNRIEENLKINSKIFFDTILIDSRDKLAFLDKNGRELYQIPDF